MLPFYFFCYKKTYSSFQIPGKCLYERYALVQETTCVKLFTNNKMVTKAHILACATARHESSESRRRLGNFFFN